MEKQPAKLYYSQSWVGTHSFLVRENLAPHIHEHYEIYYSISGKRKFYIDNQVYDIVSHDLFIIPPAKVHMRIAHIGEKFERYILFIHPKFLQPIIENGTDIASTLKNASARTHRVHLNEEQHKNLIALFEKFLSCSGYCKDMFEYMAAIEVALFACELFENNKDIQKSDFIEENEINTIIHFIEKNLASDLSPANIAKSLGMKERSTSAMFKAATNTTIYKYVISRRIAEAEKLLLENVPVTEVCERVGFNNYCHFAATFTATVGVSPKQYTKKNIKI